MRILKIIHGYPPEYNAGSEVYSESLCNELAKNHEVIVFSREENDYAPDFTIRKTRTKKNLLHFRINMARDKDRFNHPELNAKFGSLVDEIKPHIAHIGHLNHLSTGIIDELHERGIPILFTLHDFWLMCPRGQFLQRNFDGKKMFELCQKQENKKCADTCYRQYYAGINSEYDRVYWTNWIKTRMETIRDVVKKVDLFHAPSRQLMEKFINEFNIPESKIFYLDYGFPTHYLQPVKTKGNGKFTFGYIGTHIPAKGINLLINAFKQLKGNVELKIYGRTNGQNTNALRRLASDSIHPVIFAGEYINKNLANTVFNNVNCIVVPSIWLENSPLVIHEAQACRIPVITANYGGMAEYVHHKTNGLLFEHRNANSLREQMQYAVDNKADMKAMGKRGYLYHPLGNVPGIEQHTNEIFKKYKKLINNG